MTAWNYTKNNSFKSLLKVLVDVWNNYTNNVSGVSLYQIWC